MADRESGAVSRRIAAPASAIYALVTDLSRVGGWAVECEACRWLDGATGPEVGARFQGDNRFGDHTWSTVSVVDDVVPDRRFSYHTESAAEPLTRWSIALRPDGDATMVTQDFERVTLPDAKERSFEDDLFGGRVRRNLANITASLERLAKVVETDHPR